MAWWSLPVAERGDRAADMRVVAILASHNRREKTVRCLDSYFRQSVDPGVTLEAVLLDDGSSDGTASAVRRFPAVRVVQGGGDLYWAGGMAVAESVAQEASPDFILWLNDDVVLDRDAVDRLVRTVELARDAIAVGAVRSPTTGEITYSGLRRRDWHPLRFDLVTPGQCVTAVETFNGNVVLVPRQVAAKVGTLDGDLGHAAADLDYGLRARERGVSNLLAPGTVGVCERDRTPEVWGDPALPVRERLNLLVSPKGIPPRARARYLRRHGGRRWPLVWIVTYARALPSLLRRT